MLKKAVCLAAALSLLCLPCLPVLAEEGRAVVQTVPDVLGMEVGAKAAIVMELRTGKVLFAQNEHQQLPMASTTKIMTALLALEQPDIDAEFEVDPAAIRVEGSSMGLREGDKASLRTLAAGMLLLSGNDAANATAVRISGAIPGFVSLMNRRAAEIGMKNTSFETPSGLDGEFHYSTAYDMALLAREALGNDKFAAICSQYRMRVSYGNPPYNRWLTNHNKLLNYYEGAFGVKTGFTKKAGRCLVSAAQKDGVELICVTLGCPDDWTVHRNLYDQFFPTLKLQNLLEDMPDVTVAVAGGAENKVGAAPFEEAEIPVPVANAKIRYEVSAPAFVYAPVKQGQHMGEVRIFLDDLQVFTLSLVAERSVELLHPYQEEKSWWTYITDLFK